jgi:hypothetical protein
MRGHRDPYCKVLSSHILIDLSIAAFLNRQNVVVTGLVRYVPSPVGGHPLFPMGRVLFGRATS